MGFKIFNLHESRVSLDRGFGVVPRSVARLTASSASHSASVHTRSVNRAHRQGALARINTTFSSGRWEGKNGPLDTIDSQHRIYFPVAHRSDGNSDVPPNIREEGTCNAAFDDRENCTGNPEPQRVAGASVPCGIQ